MAIRKHAPRPPKETARARGLPDAVNDDEKALAELEALLKTLHPSLRRSGKLLLNSLRALSRKSRDLWEEGPYWRYTAIEPRPCRWALRAETRTGTGWQVTAESRTFTDSPLVARAVAERFTRCALSPIHLEEAIDDYVNSDLT